jgi:hypothetical protein
MADHVRRPVLQDGPEETAGIDIVDQPGLEELP